MLKRRFCKVCEDPKGFIPKHYRNIVCYKPECREIYKARQRLVSIKRMAEWRANHGTCTRCKRRMKGSGLCNSCISILSDIYADASLTEGGCFPSEVSLWVPTAEMDYGESNYNY